MSLTVTHWRKEAARVSQGRETGKFGSQSRYEVAHGTPRTVSPPREAQGE